VPVPCLMGYLAGISPAAVASGCACLAGRGAEEHTDSV